MKSLSLQRVCLPPASRRERAFPRKETIVPIKGNKRFHKEKRQFPLKETLVPKCRKLQFPSAGTQVPQHQIAAKHCIPIRC
ncbi:hypothetical protein DWX27_01940 [Bacteroides intestinalis]|uniref:Uncharacterized protein n=1 Tax=Bacteroides intestinalis TaxID=329854 RepID=A0AAQ0RVC0_9BACE|nr:hypothetical protein DWX27_01940 [Bacteroides intestinalis]